MPQPSSRTETKRDPPQVYSTKILEAPASRLFSTSSLTKRRRPLDHFPCRDLARNDIRKKTNFSHVSAIVPQLRKSAAAKTRDFSGRFHSALFDFLQIIT